MATNEKIHRPVFERPARAGKYVAVYGGLMHHLCQSRGAAEVRGKAIMVGACWLQGSLFSIDGQATMVPSPDGQVLGELYRILDPSVIRWCDERIREQPDAAGYEARRRRVNLIEPEVAAWAYVNDRLRPGDGRVIANGDWRGHLDSRTSALMLAV